MNLERLRKRVRQYLDQVGVLAAALARAGDAGLQPPSAGTALRGTGAPRSQGGGPGTENWDRSAREGGERSVPRGPGEVILGGRLQVVCEFS